mmetsp:Transcript_8068/g.13551  ORF Transcript_8068/g.13551 Transcript_8068/m.13551 type:complete len:101 (-) Transcript_8068:493-795(-)
MKCGEEHVVCNDCLLEYLRQKIENGEVERISCASSSSALSACQNIYHHSNVVSILMHFGQNEHIIKYKKFVFNHIVDTNPHIRWCPNCSKETLSCEKADD